MLKWIGGCLVLVVVVVAGGIWYGYSKVKAFAEGGPASTVTIAAPASRVFVNLADADSMAEWRAEGLGIRASHKGLLKVGDTLHVQGASAGSSRQQRSTWIVSAVTPGTLIAMEMRHDSTGQIMATRRDSIVARGDSTVVVTTLAAPFLDSLKTSRADSGKSSTMLDMTSKLMVAAMRVQSDVELKRLKARLQGDSVPPVPQPPR